MKRRPLIAGVLATDSLLALFIVLVTGISGWAKTREQFAQYWAYLLLLAIGFGVQVGLYIHLRDMIRRTSKKLVAVTGGTSAVSMVSCCLHYLANILPLISAAGVAAFIGEYQAQFFWIGLVFNAVGILVIAQRIIKARQHVDGAMDCAQPKPLLNNAVVIAAFFVVVGSVFFFTSRTGQVQSRISSGANLSASAGTTTAEEQTMTNAEGGMTVDVTPQRNADGSWDFAVAVNNHVQDVTQDMIAASSLTVASGNIVKPIAWEGDPPGGHHRSGTLKFDTLSAPPKTLTIRNLGGVPERTFEWNNLTS